MIDKRELLARARERNLPLQMIEKDYVLGWVLFGLAHNPRLVFKGGTALAKVYFPKVWRLSEDLDFVTMEGSWDGIEEHVPDALVLAADRSGLEFAIKSKHSNPGYVQFKVQYTGPLGKNWLKVDITPESPVSAAVVRPLARAYSDYPDFEVRVESIEEIMAQKLRALVQRKKVRDYYDVWKLAGMDMDASAVARMFPEKLKVQEVTWKGMGDIFPHGLQEILQGYWEKELGRLVRPVPDMGKVLKELKRGLGWMDNVKG